MIYFLKSIWSPAKIQTPQANKIRIKSPVLSMEWESKDRFVIIFILSSILSFFSIL